MGFFQSLFNKDKGVAVKKDVVAHPVTNNNTPPVLTSRNTTGNLNTAETSYPPLQPQTSHHSVSLSSILPSSSPPTSPKQVLRTSSSIHTHNSNSNSTKTPTSLSPPVSQRASQDLVRPHTARFQLLEEGGHVHHLTLPAPNRITASLNGLVTGIANKSLRLTQWTERKVTYDEVLKERAALNLRLHRTTDDKKTLAEKWGTCQETIGKGTSGVVRVAHKVEGTGERLYAVKVRRKKSLVLFKSLITFFFSIVGIT